MEKYPFGDYKIRMPKKTIQYLTQAELNRIELKDFKAERLNIIRDKYKKKEIDYASLDTPVETDDSEFYHQPADLTNNPEQIFSQKENLKTIQRAIYSLPLKYREVIVLRHIQDLSYIEISNILKLPQGTVKVHLYRAREQLKKILETNR